MERREWLGFRSYTPFWWQACSNNWSFVPAVCIAYQYTYNGWQSYQGALLSLFMKKTSCDNNLVRYAHLFITQSNPNDIHQLDQQASSCWHKRWTCVPGRISGANEDGQDTCRNTSHLNKIISQTECQLPIPSFVMVWRKLLTLFNTLLRNNASEKADKGLGTRLRSY